MRITTIPILLLVPFFLPRCATNGDIAQLEDRLGGAGVFVRAPYLVTVSDSSAVVRWRSFQASQPGFRFWSDADTVTATLPEPSQDHTFEMEGLEPDTDYFYQVQISDTLWTDAVEIHTFPVPGSRERFRFLVIGDTGTLSSGQLALAEQLNKEEAALIIHVGDVAYPDGTEQELTQKHFRVYEPILKRVPFYPSPGDHDLRTGLGRPYIDAFTPPGGRVSGSPLYYSFTHDNVRFVSLNTKESEEVAARYGYIGDPSSEQYQWLLRELSGARADPAIDWIVVYFHHAPYSASTGMGGHGSDLAVQRVIAPLMDGYRVPLVFSGHDHDYQRSRPLKGNEIVDDDEGTVYVVSGGGGGRRTFRSRGADWFTDYSEQIYEFVRVEVDRFRLKLEAVDIDGRVFDEYEMEIPEEDRKPLEREAAPLAMPEPEEEAPASVQPTATPAPR